MVRQQDPELNPNWRPALDESGGGGRLVEMWDSELCSAVSRLACVDRVFALGETALLVCWPVRVARIRVAFESLRAFVVVCLYV